MSKNIHDPRQLEQQLTMVRDEFARWADGTHRLHAVLAKTPRNFQQVGYVLDAASTYGHVERKPGDKRVSQSCAWLDSNWQLPIIGPAGDYSIYHPLAADASTVISCVAGKISEVARLIPTWTETSVPDAMHWTLVLFWLGLVVRDNPLLRTQVYELDEERPHPTGYSMRILPAGVAPDSPEWPELGFALLNRDLFTASARACDWLLAQIVSNVTDRSTKQQQQTEETEMVESSSLYCFHKTGDTWSIHYGDEGGIFSDKKGFHIIATLLRQPNPSKPFLAMELQGRDCTNADVEHTFQANLDLETIDDYKHRIADLDQEIKEAEKNNDVAAQTRLAEEREEILTQLQTDTGFDGKSRSLGPDSQLVKARKAVNVNLSTVYNALQNATPPLSKLVEHLKAAIRAEGTSYAYRHQSPPPWQFD